MSALAGTDPADSMRTLAHEHSSTRCCSAAPMKQRKEWMMVSNQTMPTMQIEFCTS